MTYTPPYEITVREDPSGGGLLSFADTPWGTLAGSGHLTIFVHGFNNGFLAARDAWIKNHGLLRKKVPPRKLKVTHFYWPGDEHNKIMSKLGYFTKVDVAEKSAKLLAFHLEKISTPRSPLSVTFVGHSLGCRVVLEATWRLRSIRNVKVEDVILLAAAVPEGLCEPTRRFAEPVAKSERIVWSSEDSVLKKYFRLGQFRRQAHARTPKRGGSRSAYRRSRIYRRANGPLGRRTAFLRSRPR